MSFLVPDLSPSNGGPVHCKAIRFSKAKGKPDLNVDFTLVFELDDVADPVLPMPLSHARAVLIGAMAGQPGGAIRADVLTDGKVNVTTFVGGEPEEVLTDLSACIRRITLHANEKNSRIVWLLRVDASPALGEVILRCLDSDVEVAFTPAQAGLPFKPREEATEDAGDLEAEAEAEEESAQQAAPATTRATRRRKELSVVEDLTDDLPAEA